MKIVLISHGPNLAVAEEPREAQGTQALLDHFRIVVRAAEEVLPPAVAAEEAAAIDGGAAQLHTRPREQFIHILCRCGR